MSDQGNNPPQQGYPHPSPNMPPQWPAQGHPQQGGAWQQRQQPQQQGGAWQQQRQHPSQPGPWQQPQQPGSWQQPQMPGGPQFRAPQGGFAPQPKKRGLAIAALVCGVVALLASPTIVAGIVLGLVAVALGVLSLRRSLGLSIAGLACGAAGVIAAFVMLVLGWTIFGRYNIVHVSRNAPDTGVVAVAVRESVRDRIAATEDGIHVIDESGVFLLDVTGVSMDAEGNLFIHYYLETYGIDSKDSYDYRWLYSPGSWTVNDTTVEPVVDTIVYQCGYAQESYFYIPADQLEGVGGLDEIYSIRGTLACDTYTGGSKDSSAEYDLAL